MAIVTWAAASASGRMPLGMAVIIAGLKLDAESRIAALLFAIPSYDEHHGVAKIEERFGKPAAHLVQGISRLNKLRPITKGFVATNIEAGEVNPAEMKAQVEVLRKMLLAMVEDIRVVLLRLASRTQTLRYLRRPPGPDLRVQVARETPGALFAAGQPAGRLGAEVGTGGPVLPLPPARYLQENRQACSTRSAASASSSSSMRWRA